MVQARIEKGRSNARDRIRKKSGLGKSKDQSRGGRGRNQGEAKSCATAKERRPKNLVPDWKRAKTKTIQKKEKKRHVIKVESETKGQRKLKTEGKREGFPLKKIERATEMPTLVKRIPVGRGSKKQRRDSLTWGMEKPDIIGGQEEVGKEEETK